MLNPNAQLWVGTLKNGRFPQTQRTLARGPGRCCLGVACELAIEAGVEVTVVEVTVDGVDDGIKSYDGCLGVLPAAVQNWLGLTTHAGDYDDDDAGLNGKRMNLIILNDFMGWSLQQIGKFVETDPPGLFKKEEPCPENKS